MGRKRTKIGFVGVGRMGANMARRLADCDYPISALYDLDETAASALAEELGCLHATRLGEVTAASDVVITVVSDDAAMRQIFTAKEDHLLTAEAKGKLFINCATVHPDVHFDIQQFAEAVGALSLEGCMASSIPQARDGSLYLMVGGSREAFRKARPILKHLSKDLTHVGEAGSAAKVKALVNMVMNMNTAALAEGLGLGAALGLDLGMLCKVFSQTGANSRVLETDAPDMIARDHDCYFSAAHAAKDSKIALTLADKKHPLPLAKATYRQYKLLDKAGLGELDKSAVAELTFPGRYPKGLKKKKKKKK
ncbi:MAG: NAD(P)-dependent oxidoreductase [Verrucomicrobiota bacterium]